MKNKKVIGLLASLGCVAIAAGAGMATTSASAETLGGVDVSSFQMRYGASVRFKQTDGKNGIRFEATLADEAYNKLEALQATAGVAVNYGMLIVPADVVASNALTEANVFGANAKYTLVADCNPDGDECTCGKTHIASVQYETLSDTNASDGKKNLRGSLVDILPKNINREFVGLGYIKYVNGTAKDYVMATNALDLDAEGNSVAGTAAQENNTRSMTYVAQLAIEKGEDDENNTLQTTYVTPLAANDYAYTINHYLPTGTDGAYVLAATETLYGKLGTSVAAVNIVKSTVENKSQYASYATYGFDTSSGAKVSSKLYANGKTVLDCYYKASNTTLWTASDETDVELMTAANTGTKTGMYADATAAVVDSYEGSGKALQMTKTSTNQYGAGHLFLDLQEAKLAEAENANWDYLTFRMLMEVEQTGLTQDSAVTYSGSVALKGQLSSNDAGTGGIPFGEWVDFTVPKALLNNKGSYILPSKSYDGAQAKAEFDEAFRKMVLTQENTSAFFFAENLAPIDGVYPTVTYYLESITWGVDTTAPEIVSVNAAYEGTAYTPTVTVKDDIVPNTAHWATKYGPIVTTTLYEVNTTDDTRTEVAAGSVLDSTKKYVLSVTANDRSVTNIPGNVLTEEVEIGVRSATSIIDINNKYDLGEFALTTYSTDSDGGATITAGVSYLESYGGVDGVALYTSHNAYFENHTDETKKWKDWGGMVYLNLDDERAETIWNAYNDTNSTMTFAITFRVDVVTSPDTTGTSYMKLGGTTSTITVGEWQTVTFSETAISQKTTWNSETKFKKALQGSSQFFQIEGVWTTNVNSAINIYIDSITYSVTPNA